MSQPFDEKKQLAITEFMTAVYRAINAVHNVGLSCKEIATHLHGIAEDYNEDEGQSDD